MTALVQSYPQQSSTVTMLQTRPSSASGPFHSRGQTQQQLQNSQMHRHVYNLNTGNLSTTSYRGHTSSIPVAPYAFTSTPTLPNNGNPLRQNPTTPHLRPENRTFSAPVIAHAQQTMSNSPLNQTRLRPPGTHMPSQESPISTSAQQGLTRDDLAVTTQRAAHNIPRPQSSIELGLPDFEAFDLGTTAGGAASTATKPFPDRYRRNHRRAETAVPTSNGSVGGSALPSGSGMATVGHLYNQPAFPASSHSQLPYRGPQMSLNQDNTLLHGSQSKPASKDDLNLPRQSSSEQAKRYRRRSVSSMEVGDFTNQQVDAKKAINTVPATKSQAFTGPNSHIPGQQDVRRSPNLPASRLSHGRTDSDESVSSTRSNSRPPSSKRETGAVIASPTALQGMPIARHEAKLVNIPPRGSSDANKRLTGPSPLSKPITMPPEASSSKKLASSPEKPAVRPTETPTLPTVSIPESPAAQHLAALNKKEAKKEGKSSRLRRAFSFGSAAELRKASADNILNNNATAERAKLRKERYHDEQEAEQAAIAQKQEAAGLGESIYSGQGHFFTGSTDNLSISSTASSASIMIRKMGKGVKKSTRSFVGLFRPKSVIGVPAADAAVPEPSVAQVSMVTVEAEREKVNVNLDPHDQAGGGTGFPKLERNSIDAASVTTVEPSLSFSDRSSDHARPRRSIVGGEKERAEVLAAVKKGILKRNGTDSGSSSPVHRPIDSKITDFTLPQLPNFNDSPTSSTPSTPTDDHPARIGHRRTDSVTFEGDDYFMSVAKFANSDSKSMPGTPRSVLARNISFSPRIQFHDTWPSQEYDRRGEIATCNRLTPMLAQQIKEELNSFKMEMEVHEQSKVYTHFF